MQPSLLRTPEKEPRACHPQFGLQEADIILISSNDTAYRVPHFTLRNTSGFFRNHLSGYSAGVDTHPPIEIAESDKVLSKVLCMICGLHTDNWESIDEVDDALALAQKWDAPGPLSTIRGAITAPMFLADPLRLYAIAAKLGWDEETRIAAAQTLSLNLYDEEHRSNLERIPSRSLMALFRLHRKRRDEFKRLVDGDSLNLFEAGNGPKSFCIGCAGEEVDNHTWRELKARMFMEMDRRPLGDTLCGLEMEEWPESIACWEAKCGKCGRLNYNKLITLRDIRQCISKLPVF
ncbi:hypothetical protein BDN70DRAFT_813919 [Pholiota conissans]|uniref:BTB domain-containing protein n=1 Tax=Pholiota conissans TaxID=109636 RepID=A0A9P5YW00_9AGAR|nr:hypothetical protein BDN70DRAFT_813919 [Pholiota conissans]